MRKFAASTQCLSTVSRRRRVRREPDAVDVLDKKHAKRSHCFVRYADDCVHERTDERRCDAVQEMVAAILTNDQIFTSM
jgi:hypothetical protein